MVSLSPPVISTVSESHTGTQLESLDVAGGHRSVPLAGREQGVVAHGGDQLIKLDGRFVIVRAWKNGADVLDPSHSSGVHVNADCGVAFLAYEDMPGRKGSPVIGLCTASMAVMKPGKPSFRNTLSLCPISALVSNPTPDNPPTYMV